MTLVPSQKVTPHTMKTTLKTSTTLIEGSLNDSKTARDIYKALPISAEVETWGDEIYFEIPVKSIKSGDKIEVIR